MTYKEYDEKQEDIDDARNEAITELKSAFDDEIYGYDVVRDACIEFLWKMDRLDREEYYLDRNMRIS